MTAASAGDGPLPTGGVIVVASATELLGELAQLIGDCLDHGCCFFIVESEERHRYVQGLVRPGRPLWLESVSNASLNGCCHDHCLSGADEVRLHHLGWLGPGDDSPNWHRSLCRTGGETLAAELLTRTLVEVHRAVPGLLKVMVHETSEPDQRIEVG